ncbi:Hypothetical predicted protein [Lecanosticta acicola]|uniref:DUF7888 domain-containing protein n=1 Tax=Lecanosticta acicola TaxID=111012 RepID=A0AAI8Z1J1_9PEZI|nr:Hypothetical predicted protein [Lecanosticta acicola]
MQFAVTFALMGLAAAAPLADSGDFIGLGPGKPINERSPEDVIGVGPGQPINNKRSPEDVIGVGPGQPINNKRSPEDVIGVGPGGPINERDALDKRVIGPGAAAVLGGVVSGIVAPAITRWANRIFGIQTPKATKRTDSKTTDISGNVNIAENVTWDEIRAAFLDGITAEIYKDASANETAVCVGVPYNISDATKVDDSATVDFSVNGQDAIFDCFVLAPGVTFSVAPENATESNVEIIAPVPIELNAEGKLITA